MSYSFKNYNVLTMPPDFFFNNDPAVDKIGQVNLSEIKTIGTVTSDTVYKIEPHQVGRSSTGVGIIYSHKLTIDLKISSDLTSAELAGIDGKIKSIVLAPKDIIIPDGVSDLSAPGVVIPLNAKVIVFKPDIIKVIEEVKLGSLEVIPIQLQLETIATTGEELKKEFGFNLI